MSLRRRIPAQSFEDATAAAQGENIRENNLALSVIKPLIFYTAPGIQIVT